MEGVVIMKRTITKMCILVVMILALTGCVRASKESVFTEGSSSMEKVIGALGESFQNETNVNFTYNPTGSSSGINGVLEGRCDIGLSSRKLTDKEENQGLTGTVLAYDGIVVIVNKENPIEDISPDDMAKIFTGEINQWSMLGGDNSQIVLIGREAGSGTRDGFEEALDIKGKCKYRQELTSTGDIITAVLNNPDAIGYVSLASVKDTVKILKIGGVNATEETIKDGSYIIQRPFVLVTKRDEVLSDSAKHFFDYIMSSKVREIILGAGVVPAN